MGFPIYSSKIPNGDKVMRDGSLWFGVGHESRSGGGVRNPFGLDFAAASHTWTAALCAKDSDGDGQSNGLELGDPDCIWSEGDVPARTSNISHPGFDDSQTSVNATEGGRGAAAPVNTTGNTTGTATGTATHTTTHTTTRTTTRTPERRGMRDGACMERASLLVSAVLAIVMCAR